MQGTHEFAATVPFDLYELHLLELVAELGSFTKAAARAGRTQSAVTRQVQGVEHRLGLALFERTTRRVTPTPAGAIVLREGSRIVGDVSALLNLLRDQFLQAPKQIRVGVSQTITLSHLPGFFAAQHARRPDVQLRFAHAESRALLDQLDAGDLDVAVVSKPRAVPSGMRITHRFTDNFILIAPPGLTPPSGRAARMHERLHAWLAGQHWLLISESSTTGARARSWLRQRGWLSSAASELDSFDLIFNLVALGQGISLVPQRTLALYGRRRKVQRLVLPEKFSREIVVLTRRHPKPPAHIIEFVENVLF